MASTPSSGRGGGKTPAGRGSGRRGGAGGDPVVQVRLLSSDVDAFTAFVQTTPLEFACAGPRVSAEGVITAHVLMRQSEAARASASDAVKVEVVADVSDTKAKRRAEVGKGNRFADSRVLPEGRGRFVEAS